MKIAIVGTEPASHGLAPWDDLSWEIWATSPNSYKFPRVDRHFEVHNFDLVRKSHPNSIGPYLTHLQQHPCVRVLIRQPELPNAELIDINAILARFGPYFLSSTISWMLAVAILSNPKEIGLWGVDCTAADEYAVQRPGVQFFLWEAERVGIKLHTPLESDILVPSPLYGLREFDNQFRKSWVRKQTLDAELENLRTQASLLSDRMASLSGALEIVNYDVRTWSGTNVTQHGRRED